MLDSVWGYGHDGYEHTVNSHINRLRAKIEQDPSAPEYIVTVWGVGYKFDARPRDTALKSAQHDGHGKPQRALGAGPRPVLRLHQ